MIVSFVQFGPGRVLLLSWTYVWVYFPNIPGNVEAAVKKLALEHCHLMDAQKTADPRLAHVPVRIVNGILQFPKSTRMTHNEAAAHFISRFPKGFKDPKLFEQELGYKRAANELFKKLFGKGRGKRLLASRGLGDVAKGLDGVL